MLKIVRKQKIATPEAIALKQALEKLGVIVREEFNDGHKNIDLRIPRANLDIEVDGIQHLIDPYQIVADLNRGYYSHEDGFNTMHIPNEMIRTHLIPISTALAEAVKIKEQQIHVHVS